MDTIPNRFNELSSDVQLEVVRLINSLASFKNSPEVKTIDILKKAQAIMTKQFQRCPSYVTDNIQNYVEHWFEEYYDRIHEDDSVEELEDFHNSLTENSVYFFKDLIDNTFQKAHEMDGTMITAILNTVKWDKVIEYLKVYLQDYEYA